MEGEGILKKDLLSEPTPHPHPVPQPACTSATHPPPRPDSPNPQAGWPLIKRDPREAGSAGAPGLSPHSECMHPGHWTEKQPPV